MKIFLIKIYIMEANFLKGICKCPAITPEPILIQLQSTFINNSADSHKCNYILATGITFPDYLCGGTDNL